MSKSSFFTNGPASDFGYENVRAARNEFTARARENCEALWKIYAPYADAHFLIEVKRSFDARYWEMYLATFLIHEGYDISCPKPGPDVGIEVSGRRIWFEATCPTRGADGSPNQVPKRRASSAGQLPVVEDVPNERMILRYLNSIATKYNEQYVAWLKQGVVCEADSFIIAINPRGLGHDHADTSPPRVLQAAFEVGNPYVSIDSETMTKIDEGYMFRDKIEKASGSEVPTGVFNRDEYIGLSGLLCSRVDVVNQPENMGEDFQFVTNPRARAKLPDGFRLKGVYFRVDHNDEGYLVTPEASDR